MDILLILGPLWLLFGAAAAFVANARGGDGLTGFLLGLFLGPLGLVIACFTGSEAKRDERDVVAGAKKVCPRCAETVLRAALVCKHCGAEFDPASCTLPEQERLMPVYVKYEGETADAASLSARSAAADRWLIGGALVAVVVAILIAMAGALASSDKSQPSERLGSEDSEMVARNLEAAADALDAAAANISR